MCCGGRRSKSLSRSKISSCSDFGGRDQLRDCWRRIWSSPHVRPSPGGMARAAGTLADREPLASVACGQSVGLNGLLRSVSDVVRRAGDIVWKMGAVDPGRFGCTLLGQSSNVRVRSFQTTSLATYSDLPSATGLLRSHTRDLRLGEESDLTLRDVDGVLRAVDLALRGVRDRKLICDAGPCAPWRSARGSSPSLLVHQIRWYTYRI